MSTISCEATLGYAIETISTRTNGICEVGCGQILRQISSKIKSRTDQSVTRKAKHSSMLGVLIIWKKKSSNGKQLRYETNEFISFAPGTVRKKSLCPIKISDACTSYL